ncbi:hypothetical protein CG08_1796 [Riemerella anatipestifer]|uniref:hypothetical protein n=1 Tax=Riemerella anatipestifer TaxID=34085 RepID=UPI0002AB4006|nr:hypothetical protein [Riemerella anatipestifer]AGC41296.1 hypothetical protein G148_1992 [Riemerella anatipestifer RA-CH-2]AKP69932.1 hypothetical protein CG08_1796 [Riemerella anatipestifer]AKP71895.1 hypothetical protein CG09_1770 [Riemerella anatipestifer]MBF2799071.1 hypothetical protein [Riemerella anatipestifer]
MGTHLGITNFDTQGLNFYHLSPFLSLFCYSNISIIHLLRLIYNNITSNNQTLNNLNHHHH